MQSSFRGANCHFLGILGDMGRLFGHGRVWNGWHQGLILVASDLGGMNSSSHVFAGARIASAAIA